MTLLAAVIVIATLGAMASGRMPPVLALATGLVVAGITGVAPVESLLAGLGNSGVITVGAMLVIAKGIVQTGVVSRLTWSLLSSVTTARQALRRLMLPIGAISTIFNTTPIVAVLVPAARELDRTRKIPTREFLLPIAHVTTLAGAITLIGTSSNLLISGIADENGVEMGMLSFAPVALPVAVVGGLVVYLTSSRLLRGESAAAEEEPRDWRVEIPVSAHALAVKRTAGKMGIERTEDYDLLQINRGDDVLEPNAPIGAGDVLVFMATQRGIEALWQSPLFGLSPDRLYAISISAGESGTLHDIERKGTLHVVAAHTTVPLSQTPIIPGDICFVTGQSADVLKENGSIGMWRDAASRVPQPAKTWIAVFILLAVVTVALFDLVPIELASSAGAVAMVLAGVITPNSAVRALNWNVLFILAGSVGLGAVVVESGLSDIIAESIQSSVYGNPLLMVVVIVLATVVLTNLVTNAAAASILAPVGLELAGDFNVDPAIVLAAIATCVSLTFINPYSHQSNMMVMYPGGYTSAAFARFGIPLTVMSTLMAIAMTWVMLRA